MYKFENCHFLPEKKKTIRTPICTSTYMHTWEDHMKKGQRGSEAVIRRKTDNVMTKHI
jgi:hypothetical protein